MPKLTNRLRGNRRGIDNAIGSGKNRFVYYLLSGRGAGRDTECAITNSYSYSLRLFFRCKSTYNQLKKGNPMKNLKLLMMVVMLAGITGCLSIGSDKPGPQGPKGDPGTSEKVIVVPEKQY
jgi:hypothetical protein